MANQAAWLKANRTPIKLGPAEKYELGAGELLIKIQVVGVSPVDSRMQTDPVRPIPYPFIIGGTYAGTVEAIGAGVEIFERGDRVIALSAGGDPRFGAFQKYALASATMISKLPPSVPLESAATTAINLATAVSALSIHLPLDQPPLTGTAQLKGKKVFIYGGSSSVGGQSVRYAATAGYEVVTTSSPKHRDFVQSLGPSHIIDHTQGPDAILQEIKRHGPYTAIFDTIAIPPVTNIIFKYLDSIGGGVYNACIPLVGGEDPKPANVEQRFAPYPLSFSEPKNKDIGRWFYEEYLPKGLESGLVVPTRAQVVEGGLEGVQSALDLLDQRKVSGAKLILYPWGKP